MTLAEELMGLRPYVPLSPGKIISFDDPEEVVPPKPARAVDKFFAWLPSVEGEFTTIEITEALGCDERSAASFIGHASGRDLIKLVGQIKRFKKRPLRIWKRVEPPKDRGEAMARKHFG